MLARLALFETSIRRRPIPASLASRLGGLAGDFRWPPETGILPPSLWTSEGSEFVNDFCDKPLSPTPNMPPTAPDGVTHMNPTTPTPSTTYQEVCPT